MIGRFNFVLVFRFYNQWLLHASSVPKKRASEPIVQDFGSAMAPPRNQCCRVDAPGFRLAGLIACAGYLQECFAMTSNDCIFFTIVASWTR